MNGEDQKLTLGAVEPTDMESSQPAPDMSIDEYLTRLREMGVNDQEAINVMSSNGYNSQEVHNTMVSQYEQAREEFLRKQEEAKRREEEAKQRLEEMSAEKKKSEPSESLEEPSVGELSDQQLLDTFDPNRAVKKQFDDPSQVEARGTIDTFKYRDIVRDNPDLNDPYSNVALPADIVDAMQRGEDVSLRYHSYTNDSDIYDNYTAKRGVAEINEAIKKKDVRAYNALREEMNAMGYSYPPVEEFDEKGIENASSYSVLAFDMLEKQSMDLLRERNSINEEFGLPSGFNPNSDVDFMYAVKESIERQQVDYESSELAEYEKNIKDQAEREYVPGFMGEAVIKGFLNGAVKSVVDAGKYSLPGMYYEFIGDDQKYNAYMTANKRSQDIEAEKKRINLRERFDMPDDLIDMGVSEATTAMLNGEVSQEDYLNKIMYESGEFFGGALSYMIPIGRASKALNLAKAGAKAIPKGAGVLTGQAAKAATAADRALRVAKFNNNAVFTALGVTSGADTYAGLYDRKDLSFSEKMVQGALVGVAEATLGKMFSSVDELLVSGASATVRARTAREFSKMAKDKLAELTKRRALATAAKETGKGLSQEFMEEFGVEVVAQGAEILNDVLMGRQPKDIDWYGLIDSGIAGLIGAGPTSVMAGIGSYQAHSDLIKRRKKIADDLGEVEAKLDNAKNPEERKLLGAIKQGLSSELMAIDGASREAFSKLSDGQRRRLLKIHRDMAYTENALKKKDLSKEEREQLEQRYELLLRSKQAIEESAETPDMTKNDPPVKSQDAGNKETEVKSEPVSRNEKVKTESAEQAQEAAPEQEAEEESQLSTFDESKEEDAPAPEKKAEPAPKEEAAPAEGVNDFTDLGSDLVDVTDSTKVGTGPGKISLEVAMAANRMSKAFGGTLQASGYKVRLFNSREAFNKATNLSEDKAGGAFGFVNHTEKTINLAPDATTADVIEEFAHAALKDIIGKDAEAREAIYQVLSNIAKKNPGVAQILSETRNNEVYSKQGEAAIQEESIVAVLIAYAEQPSALKQAGFVNKMRAVINKILGKYVGDTEMIENEAKFLEFAKKFAAATKGDQVQITDPGITKQETKEEDLQKRPDESQEEYQARLEKAADAMMPSMTEEEQAQQEFEEGTADLSEVRFAYGKRKTEFNYLKDTTVYYSEDGYVNHGEAPQFERQASKKIKVNDYFHFRNWYNYMTSNGTRAGRITKMYFIKDGKKYTIKPPKPKTDRNGNVVKINGAPNAKITNANRAWEKDAKKAVSINEARKEFADFSGESRILKVATGVDHAAGNAFVPGFPYAEYSKLKGIEKEMFLGKWELDNIANRTAEEQMELVEIARANFEALRQSGMSASEIEAADKETLFNMSGRRPSFDQTEGSTTDTGEIRFAFESRKASPALTARARIMGLLSAKFKEFAGALALNAGYDRSEESVNAGVLEQAGKDIDGNPIILSHRTGGMADAKFEEMKRLALRDSRGKRKGYIVVTQSILSIGSLAGNPRIFSELVNTLVNQEGFSDQDVIDAINDFLDGENDTVAAKNYIKIIKSNAFRKKNSLLRLQSDAGSGRIKIKTIQEAKDFLEVMNVMDTELGVQQNFQDRNSFGRRIVKGILARDGKPAGKADIDQYLIENYEDDAFADQPTNYIITATKVPYTIDYNDKDERGNPKVKGFYRSYDSAEGTPFPHAIVFDKERSSELDLKAEWEGTKFLEEQPSLKDAYATAKVTEEQEVEVDGKTTKVKREVTAFPKKRKNESEEEYEARIKKRQDFLGGKGVSGKLNDDIVYSYRPGGRATFDLRNQSAFGKWKSLWIRRLQDKYVDIFNIQEDIERQRGRVDITRDFKAAEELMYGKAAEDLAKLDRKVEEITKMMKDSGIKVDEISRYLYALHAKERNAVIFARSKGAVTDGSGISDADADAILNSANKKALDPIVAKIREIQADTRKTMVKYGLETQQTVDAFESMFQNYVPLAGLSVDEELSSPYPTGGAGMNVFGSTTKRATGRKTEAENILAQIVAQNASIHIKARTNEALNALYNLVQDNPNPKVWRLLDDSGAVDPTDPRMVSVRVNGKQKFIMFKDSSYAESLRGMNLPQTNAFVRAMRVPAQWLRRSFTTLNPEFVISNFSRDIQAAIFNASAEADIEGGMLNSKKTVKRMMKLVPETLRTLVKNSVQKGGDPAIEKYFEEFKEDGGKTGWAYAKSLDQIANELQGATEDKTRTQELFGKAKNWAETVEGVNDAFENSIRLAAYIAARENGVSREKAAQMAKNVTVNFNKQGEWGPALNSVYLFFNASIQGTARLGRSLLSLRPQKRPDGTDRKAVERITSAQWMAGGLMIFNAMLTMLGYAMSDEDEDGTLFWDKIPDYVKERNLIIMRPNGKDYFKIPMPYGFNVFANMGNALVEASNGSKEPDEAMMFLFNSFMASFSPVSFGQSKDLFVAAGKGAVPTVMKPFVDVMVNETYFGGPVTGENLPFGVQRPESELSFRSPEAVKDFFSWMNEATGGSEYKSGEVDINPDKFWYMFEYFVGGAGQFVGRTFSLPAKMSSKLLGKESVDIQANEIPIARILYGEPSNYFDFELFQDNKQEFKSLYKEMTKAPVREPGRYKGINEGMNKTLNEIDKYMKQLRKAKKEARKIEDYNARMARIQEIREKERKLIMKWNKIYEQARN